jgi:D-tyrosyl-tRNA(Tyr) deacylase
VVVHRVRRARLPDRRTLTDALVALVGFTRGDDQDTCRRMARRVVRARVFPSSGSMVGASALDRGAPLLVVSQMPLAADTTRGAKPDLSAGAPSPVAASLYATFVDELVHAGAAAVEAVPFGSSGEIDLRHWGPFTVVLDG